MYVGYSQAETAEFIISLTRVTCVVGMCRTCTASGDGAPKKLVSTVALYVLTDETTLYYTSLHCQGQVIKSEPCKPLNKEQTFYIS